MTPKERAESIVQMLEQYLGAREAVIHHGSPITFLDQTRGFLKIGIEMMIEELTKKDA